MRIRLTALSTTAALLLVAALASSSSANRLSIGIREFAFDFVELTFETTTPVTCAVILGGTFSSRTLRKALNTTVGVVNEALVESCRGDGRATVLRETLPWTVAYNGFTGTLPNISAVRLLMIGASFQVSDSGVTCLVRTDSAEPAGFNMSANGRGGVTSVSADASREIDIDTAEFLCELAGDVQLVGTGSVGGLDVFQGDYFFFGDKRGDSLKPGNQPDSDIFDKFAGAIVTLI